MIQSGETDVPLVVLVLLPCAAHEFPQDFCGQPAELTPVCAAARTAESRNGLTCLCLFEVIDDTLQHRFVGNSPCLFFFLFLRCGSGIRLRLLVLRRQGYLNFIIIPGTDRIEGKQRSRQTNRNNRGDEDRTEFESHLVFFFPLSCLACSGGIPAANDGTVR